MTDIADQGRAAPSPDQPAYRVLARKYRPTRFEDLIGQDAMVRILTNAFALNRVHQAYILTGVRGIGKTTSARILARAFNYSVPGVIDAPSVDMPVLGVHCQEIIESRHVDVIEMDAASHTGIDDVRQIIENARYKPVSARMKVYIIDEVHMLSKQAFNGLLKTLEEPPPHVKFIFATTEIEKVPITVRSRCVRFDLRRIDADVMTRHLQGICAKEEVKVDDGALALIVRAAEGSVRDALSLLDQAIARGGADDVGEAMVRDMLGLSDRGLVADLFENAMKGKLGPAIEGVRSLHQSGADPAQILLELAEFTHLVTRFKLGAVFDPTISEYERGRAVTFSEMLDIGALTRAWQILLKAHDEMRNSPRPLASAEMALVRLGHASNLPSPDEALRRLAELTPARSAQTVVAAPAQAVEASAPRITSRAPMPESSGAARAFAEPRAERFAAPPAPAEAAAPCAALARFEDVVALARSHRDIRLQAALESEVRLARFEQGRIEFSVIDGVSPQIAQTLSRRLQEWTGDRWMTVLVPGCTAPTLREQDEAREREKRSGVEAHPLVQAVMKNFPGAAITEVRRAEPLAAAAPAPSTDDDIAYPDAAPSFDDE
jgi:DNA polymerase-3 subunit gamma/tau